MFSSGRLKYNVQCPKNIRGIIDCNLNKNYQILIIFGTNIRDTTRHQMTIQVPTYPKVRCNTEASAPPRESRTNEILHFYPRQYCYLIKIMHINRILFTFLSLWLTVYPLVQLFSTKNC